MLSINTSTSLMTAQRMFDINSRSIFRSLERLATGQRINRGSDDPAGLIASENLRATLAALESEVRSLQRADNVANVAEGALGSTSDQLIQASGLAVTAANSAGMSDEERAAIQMEMDSILSSIDMTAGNTSFGGQQLLDGNASISAGTASVDLPNANSSSLGETEVDGTTYTLADLRAGGSLNLVDGDIEIAQQVIRNALTETSSARGQIGSFQRHTIGARINNSQTTMENIAAANSVIRDTDYAAEIVALNRGMILQSASMKAMSMILPAQASVLQLLGR